MFSSADTYEEAKVLEKRAQHEESEPESSHSQSQSQNSSILVSQTDDDTIDSSIDGIFSQTIQPTQRTEELVIVPTAEGEAVVLRLRAEVVKLKIYIFCSCYSDSSRRFRSSRAKCRLH